MRKKIIFSLYKKEMLDILRDKKTILMMIVVPLILYPLIFAGSMFLASSMLTASTSKSYRIGFENFADEQTMIDAFDKYKDGHDSTFVYYRPGTDEDEEEKLRNGDIDAYLIESVSDNKPYYQIAYMASKTDSQTASGMIKDILQDIQNEKTDAALKAEGLDPDAVLKPISYTYLNLATDEENAGYLVGMVVPFLLITSILMGALYPAIDATAGEKERGTLETLLTLPVKNLELIVAKFFATSTVAVGAAFLNILSMSLMAGYMLVSAGSVDATADLELSSFIPAVIITFLCVLTFAMFASAVCLSACIFARSFKEAQNYTTPVMLVFMVCGMAGMIPQLTLNSVTALIPVVNISLLITEIFSFRFEISRIAMVLISNLAYTAVAVVIMGRLFSSESILFGDAAGSLRLLESRKHMKDKQIPGIGDVIMLFAMLLIVVLFGGGILVLKMGLWGLVAEQAMIFGLTVFYAWYIKADRTVVFHLHAPRVPAVIGGVLSWAGAYLLVQLLANLVTVLFPGLASNQNAQMLQELWTDAPKWLMILSSALMPAICEEWAFRGFMLGSFEFKFKPAVAIVLTGVFFALFHMSLLQLIIIAPLGILFSYIVWKERSIFITMILHFLNNLTSLILEEYQEELTEIFPFLAGELTAGGVVLLLVIGSVLLAAGLLIIHGKKKEVSAS